MMIVKLIKILMIVIFHMSNSSVYHYLASSNSVLNFLTDENQFSSPRIWFRDITMKFWGPKNKHLKARNFVWQGSCSSVIISQLRQPNSLRYIKWEDWSNSKNWNKLHSKSSLKYSSFTLERVVYQIALCKSGMADKTSVFSLIYVLANLVYPLVKSVNLFLSTKLCTRKQTHRNVTISNFVYVKRVRLPCRM